MKNAITVVLALIGLHITVALVTLMFVWHLWPRPDMTLCEGCRDLQERYNVLGIVVDDIEEDIIELEWKMEALTWTNGRSLHQ